MPESAHQPQQSRPATSAAQRRRAVEEDRAWASVYSAVRHASTAEEVVKQLDGDPDAKRAHMALYIRAKTTLRQRKAIEARNQRVGAFVRQVLAVLVLGPVHLAMDGLAALRDLLVATLPALQREPAVARARVLQRDPAFAPAKDRFDAAEAVPEAVPEGKSASRKAA